MVASLYFGSKQISQLATGEKLALFAEYVWVLQWAVWRFYSPAYLEEDEEATSDTYPNTGGK